VSIRFQGSRIHRACVCFSNCEIACIYACMRTTRMAPGTGFRVRLEDDTTMAKMTPGNTLVHWHRARQNTKLNPRTNAMTVHGEDTIDITGLWPGTALQIRGLST
jgi:hypothetical protein